MLFHTPASEDGTEGEDWQGEYLLVKGVSLQRNYPEWRLCLFKKRHMYNKQHSNQPHVIFH